MFSTLLSRPKTSKKVRCLLLSGVNISKPVDPTDTTRPLPDYYPVCQELEPDIIDASVALAGKNPLYKLVNHFLGSHFAVGLYAFFRQHKYDVVVTTGEDVGFPLALYRKLTFFIKHPPLLITCQTIGIRRSDIFLKKLRVGSAVTTFLCTTQTLIDLLIKEHYVKPEQIYYLLLHVDHNFFSPMPNVPVRNQLCSTGMASRDYATLVKAATGMDIDVIIDAGSQWFDEKLNFKDSDLPSNVRRIRSPTLKDVRQLYAESQFVVVPLKDVSFTVGLTVILEAMAMGKAVIATKVQQHEDFIEEGKNGAYVEPENVEDLREKIRYFQEHPEEVRRMGEYARKCVEQKYTLEHYVERLSEAINQVLPARV
ncbi:MAG TPA: glycosyltransferase family 4 protein [Chloroflexia bacterium]|nr:glycosyltransferase family 4 protein [Chloroflexia bacterium]